MVKNRQLSDKQFSEIVKLCKFGVEKGKQIADKKRNPMDKSEIELELSAEPK